MTYRLIRYAQSAVSTQYRLSLYGITPLKLGRTGVSPVFANLCVPQVPISVDTAALCTILRFENWASKRPDLTVSKLGRNWAVRHPKLPEITGIKESIMILHITGKLSCLSLVSPVSRLLPIDINTHLYSRHHHLPVSMWGTNMPIF